MTDIATLGIRIDSRDTVAAKTALDGLTASAKPAAAAAAALEKSTSGAGKGAAQLATGTGLARHEVVNLSRQMQDLGVSLASGQSPFLVMIQQGTQIADIYGSSKTGTVGGSLKQLVNFVGPANLLAGGLVAVAAAGVLAVSALANSEKKIDDVSRAAGTAATTLRDLTNAAEIKGIDNDEFLKSAQRFGSAVYEARNNMGELGEFLRANGQSAKTFDDAFGKVANLIKNARDDQERLQLLQRAGLPATMEWVKFMSQGRDGIAAAVAELAKAEPATAALVAKAREFDERWATGWANFKQNARNATLDVSGWLDTLADKATRGLMAAGVNVPNNVLRNAAQDQAAGLKVGSKLTNSSNVDDFYKGTGAGMGAPGAAGKAPVDPAVLQRSISLQQQQLSLYGQTATAAEAVRQVELQAQSARLNGVSIDEKRVEVLKRLAAEQTIGVTAIKASTDAANIDAATVGMATGKAAEYTAATNALNEAKRAGRELTPENIAQIRQEAAALGAAAANADNMRFAYTNLVQGPMQTFTSAIQSGATAMDALKKAGVSALSAVANKLMEMAAQNLWSSAFGGSGGLFSGLFGGGGASAGAITLGGAAGPVPFFAEGTNSAPGGWSVVGEKGPELMNVPRGAQILPNGVMPGGGGTPVVMNDNRVMHIGAGASQETVAQLKQALAEDRATRHEQTVAIVKSAQQRRQL